MRFLGIDLGTTNSSLAYSDGLIVEDLKISQILGEDLYGELDYLPSFLYCLEPNLRSNYDLDYLGDLGFSGLYAKELFATKPDHVIRSAKSWVSLGNLSSDANILPEGSLSTKYSPVLAQSQYVEHLLKSYQKKYKLPKQIIVTIPASFSDIARKLTLKSVKYEAILLEEPLAAFYNWQFHNKDLKILPKNILVIDIGGGTTDFSLLKREKEQYLRSAVGKHLLLGGDNLDLSLALMVEQKHQAKFKPLELAQILAQARIIKEKVFLSDELDFKFILKGEGSGLFKKAKTIVLEKKLITDLFLNGFFPIIDDFKADNTHDLGIRQFGLPYSKNPAISWHLIDFLKNNLKEPLDAVLFHGGSLIEKTFQNRLLSVIENELGSRPEVLINPNIRLGVSHGACIYALAREGLANLVDAGITYSLFVGIELKNKTEKLLCVGKARQKEGEITSPDLILNLKAHERVRFPLYKLNRENSHIGDLIANDNYLVSAQLETKLLGKDPIIPVRIEAEILPTQELRLSLKNQRDNQQNFILDFALNQEIKTINQENLKILDSIYAELNMVFGNGSNIYLEKDLKKLFTKLEALANLKRKDWPINFCRKIAEKLIDSKKAMRRSPIHEMLFYTIFGFCARPGFSYNGDEELINALDIRYPHFNQVKENRLAYWIFIRRIAGGLSKELQNSLYESYSFYFFPQKTGLKLPGANPESQELKEMLRAFCSMEHLSYVYRKELLNYLIKQVKKQKLTKNDYWLLARVATRKPFYAPLQSALLSEDLDQLIDLLLTNQEFNKVAESLVFNLGHRDFYLADLKRSQLINFFNLIAKETLATKEIDYSFGESLPLGLRL